MILSRDAHASRTVAQDGQSMTLMVTSCPAEGETGVIHSLVIGPDAEIFILSKCRHQGAVMNPMLGALNIQAPEKYQNKKWISV